MDGFDAWWHREMPNLVSGEEADDRAIAKAAWEAATALQPSVGGEVVETMINHARDPHCIGCYVVRWNDGAPVAECNECGATVALLDGLASPAQADGFVLVPVAPTDDMLDAGIYARDNHGTVGQIYAAMLTAAPSAPRGLGEE